NPPGALEVAAEAAQHLLVEDRHGGARRRVEHDQADRVRADVDDAVPVVLEARPRRHDVGSARNAETPALRSALPRPERLGLVMKSLWALTASGVAGSRV